MDTREDLRNKLKKCLKEQERELRGRRKSGKFMEMLSALHPDNYDDFVNSLTDWEKSEMLDEVPLYGGSEEYSIFSNFVNGLRNDSLMALIFSVNGSANFCERWLTEERFEKIFNQMEILNVKKIFCHRKTIVFHGMGLPGKNRLQS